ncbi:MAG TPA: SDR family oxidoreductase [Bacteroidales bacterium]|nr:SDR family oxidoreductase [Bacteroidales bacterium]
MRTVLITGGNSGIGKATVAGLAQRGWHVIFTARNEEKAESVKKEIIESTKNQYVDYLLADLTSIKQVKECAEAFKNKFRNLDVLINNAGVCLPERRITPDGMEESFQINHLSHFILTNLLIDNLKHSEDPRIVNVSSAAHAAGRFDPDNLQSEKQYSSIRTYADTKLYNILFTLELAGKLKDSGIKVNVLHPGMVSTNFGHEFGGVFNFIYNIGRVIMITPEKGATTSIYLATSDEISNVSGKYFIRCKPAKLKNPYLTEANQKLLWQKSMELAEMNLK